MDLRRLGLVQGVTQLKQWRLKATSTSEEDADLPRSPPHPRFLHRWVVTVLVSFEHCASPDQKLAAITE